LKELPHSYCLSEVITSAAAFGITVDDLLNAMVATPDHLPVEVKALYVDELTGELAKRLLEKQRR
jgi:hypothetical protein